ncbi:MAG: ABC transporter ATP-binding protein [Cumulibacter sp.]
MSHKSDMLRIDDLAVTYRGGHRALDGVSLTVGCDEVVALVGESGCGKTTTLRTVLGLLPASARVTGAIELDGQPLAGLRKRERSAARVRAGYVTQDPYSAFDPLRTVSHHILEPLRPAGIAISEVAVLDALCSAGIPDASARWTQYPHQWSGGMLQRADIVAAALLEPSVTLADEPTSALDAELADDMMHLLRRSSKGLLFVTHDLDLAARHADRIIVLDGGRIVEEGTSETVMAQPRARRTMQLVQSAALRATVDPAVPPVEGAQRDRVVARLDRVAKRYATRHGVHTAVAGIDLRVHAGEIVGICGRSGSGKSTLLRLMGGIEEPDSGTATRAGGPGNVLPIFQDPVGSLDARWPIWRSITEPIAAAARRDGARPPHRARRRELAAEVLADVGLGDIDPDVYPRGLSVGQCQRVAIARVICARPALMIADEPTSSLDVTTATEIGRLLHRLRESGTAQVIVSHDIAFLRYLSDRIYRMVDGTLTQEHEDAPAPVQAARRREDQAARA